MPSKNFKNLNAGETDLTNSVFGVLYMPDCGMILPHEDGKPDHYVGLAYDSMGRTVLVQAFGADTNIVQQHMRY